MARCKAGAIFSEAAGKMVESIEYTENGDWQALEVTFIKSRDLYHILIQGNRQFSKAHSFAILAHRCRPGVSPATQPKTLFVTND